MFNQLLLLKQAHKENCTRVSRRVSESSDSSSYSDTSTSTNSMSDLDRPTFSPIKSTSSSEDEGDECEGCSSKKQPTTAMPFGPADVED